MEVQEPPPATTPGTPALAGQDRIVRITLSRSRRSGFGTGTDVVGIPSLIKAVDLKVDDPDRFVSVGKSFLRAARANT